MAIIVILPYPAALLFQLFWAAHMHRCAQGKTKLFVWSAEKLETKSSHGAAQSLK